jgi:hypothetical protein
MDRRVNDPGTPGNLCLRHGLSPFHDTEPFKGARKMDTDLNPVEPQRDTLATTMSRVSNLVPFILLFCVVATLGVWGFSKDKKESKSRSRHRTLSQRMADENEARLIEIQDYIDDQLQEGIDYSSAWQGGEDY